MSVLTTAVVTILRVVPVSTNGSLGLSRSSRVCSDLQLGQEHLIIVVCSIWIT